MTDRTSVGESLVKCPHCKFGLIVTGEGERLFLPKLFSLLMARAGCSFEVFSQIGQRSALGPKQQIKMVGCGKIIPDKDEKMGLDARRYLGTSPCRFVILVDDVERARRSDLPAIFQRYSAVFDAILLPEQRQRASIHFLANMLEAYYFADHLAVDVAMEIHLLDADHTGNVEDIGHPKVELKGRANARGISFDEKIHGHLIISQLRVDHVRSHTDTCQFLRSLFAWCVKKLTDHCQIYQDDFDALFCLVAGEQAEVTRHQV